MNKIKFLRSKLKFFSDIYNGNSIPDDKKDFFVNKKIPYIATKSIDADTHQIDYENGLSVNEDDGFRIAKTKSSLLCIEGGSAGKKLGYLNQEAAFVNKLCCFTPENIDPKFLFYSLQSSDFLSEFSLHLTGMIGGVKIGEIKNLYISHPDDLGEQQKIAFFLDKKVGQIDNLISNQEKQIEKLKEYRQAIITKAVTKGLDPNVPMKDSGIGWIGEIPNNVNVSSVKNFYEITLGKMLQPKQENENDTLEYYFCAANLGNNCLKTDDLKQMWFSVKEKEKYSLKKGDLLVVEGGDVASSSIIGTDVSNIYFQNSIHRVRPIHGLNEYLHYYLIFVKGSGYFDVNCNKATIMHFTKDKFSNLPFLIRNTEEQKKIVTFLNKEETKINRLISIKEKKIEFLTNYKKSLIYEYVTGKKRVLL